MSNVPDNNSDESHGSENDSSVNFGSNSSGEYILFIAGDVPLYTKSASIHCVHEAVMTQRESGTQSWFLGLAVVDGRLLPITDLGAFFGNAPSHGRIIEVAHGIGHVGLRVDDVHGFADTQPPNHEYLDIAELLQSEQFLNIYREPA